jgi:hypothetical protein
MKRLLIACSVMILSCASFPAQSEKVSGVVGGGVYCATVNGQCVPVGSFTLDALSPSTGTVTAAIPFPFRTVTVRLDCVDIEHTAGMNLESSDTLRASGLDIDGNRWGVLADQSASGRFGFFIWRQEPDVGVCGLGDGLIIGSPKNGRLIFFHD